MNYGYLFSEAWEIIKKNRFLILLGVLVFLGSWGGGGSGSSGLVNGGDGDFGYQQPMFDYDLSFHWESIGLSFGALILVGFALVIVAAFWSIGTISRGGLIYGADAASRGHSTNFGESFQAGWKKGWRLIGIGLVPAIPMILLIVVALVSAGIFQNRTVILNEAGSVQFSNALTFLPIIGAILLLYLVLSLLRTFANLACMLEDTGVFGSYRKGWQVLGKNLGPAIILFVLQIAFGIVIGLALFVPGILVTLCCFLWPLLLIVQGAFTAYYSTLWTLAWNQWTGTPTMIAPGAPA